MNPEIKRLWITALLSGEYQQGRGALKRRDGKFCCLGVLCELYAKHNLNAGQWLLGGNLQQQFYFQVMFLNERAEGILPEAVRQWAGLVSQDPEMRVASKTNTFVQLIPLSELNDGTFNIRARDFKEIAALIQEQL